MSKRRITSFKGSITQSDAPTGAGVTARLMSRKATDREAVETEQEDEMTTKLVVSHGQYETSAVTVTVHHKTESGLMRRARQLSREYAVYGDNWAGWIKADVAVASPNDIWGDNSVIGGRWCDPANGWLDLSKN